MADYIDAVIMLLAGIWATTIGFNKPLASGADAAGNDRRARVAPLLRLFGPLLMLIALVLAGAVYFGAALA